MNPGRFSLNGNKRWPNTNEILPNIQRYFGLHGDQNRTQLLMSHHDRGWVSRAPSRLLALNASWNEPKWPFVANIFRYRRPMQRFLVVEAFPPRFKYEDKCPKPSSEFFGSQPKGDSLSLSLTSVWSTWLHADGKLHKASSTSIPIRSIYEPSNPPTAPKRVLNPQAVLMPCKSENFIRGPG